MQRLRQGSVQIQLSFPLFQDRLKTTQQPLRMRNYYRVRTSWLRACMRGWTRAKPLKKSRQAMQSVTETMMSWIKRARRTQRRPRYLHTVLHEGICGHCRASSEWRVLQSSRFSGFRGFRTAWLRLRSLEPNRFYSRSRKEVADPRCHSNQTRARMKR